MVRDLTLPILVLLSLTKKWLCITFFLFHIAKNLLSVSKFAHDNDVYFEFHPYSYCVKDKKTGANLLKGILDKGLYKFDMTFLGAIKDIKSTL